LTGGLLQAISHATAKAGMFMAAGLIYAALGHDRIADLGGVARAMPITVLTFAVAGVALMGVVPSGAYLAKKLLLYAADDSGQWWWTIVLQGGAVFTAGYVVLVLVNALRRVGAPITLVVRVSRRSEFAALALAVCSLLLALAALGPVPGDLVSNPLAPAELGSTLLTFAGGALLALGFARRSLLAPGRDDADAGPVRRGMVALGAAVASADVLVRRWPSASVALLAVTALFGWMLAAGTMSN
jgi:NADH:ubiquinone oxidoreductase subunit 5 (subunit L)/multisubunit Na+/H+ antiporter MnhA subunit